MNKIRDFASTQPQNRHQPSYNNNYNSTSSHLYRPNSQNSVFPYGAPKRNPHADPTYFYQDKRIPFMSHTRYHTDPTQQLAFESDSFVHTREKTKIQNELMQIFNRLAMIPGCDAPANHVRAAWTELKDIIYFNHLHAEQQVRVHKYSSAETEPPEDAQSYEDQADQLHESDRGIIRESEQGSECELELKERTSPRVVHRKGESSSKSNSKPAPN